jgi:hypothetical protein
MVEQLFGSKTRVKLLKLFMSNPNRSFFVREITRKVDEQINSVRRELANLLSLGVITSDNSNNKLYYEVNQKYEFFDPLAVMFGGAKVKKTSTSSVGSKEVAADTPNAELAKIGFVTLAFLTGFFTRDESSGVDLVIVGDVNKTKAENFVKSLEEVEKREVRYVLFAEKDFLYRRQVNDRFTVTALSAKKQVLIDKLGLLG